MNHRHIIIKAEKLAKPDWSIVALKGWLEDLVKSVGMKVMIGPVAERCHTPGNEGVTGFVVIETSHASIHIWDKVEEPYLQFDLYSCEDFDIDEVIDHVMHYFEPQTLHYVLIDRNGTALHHLESGSTWPGLWNLDIGAEDEQQGC